MSYDVTWLGIYGNVQTLVKQKKSHIEHIVQVLTGPNCGKLK